MSKPELDGKILQAWDDAKPCNCGIDDCQENHKLCAICNTKVFYCAHESKQPNSEFAWNIDHITPKSKGGSNANTNLQITCLQCNAAKKDNSKKGLGNLF